MKLSVLKRNQPLQEIDLGKDVLSFDYSETIFLIGRSKDCHVVLDDRQVSREHLRIIHKGGIWNVEKTNLENACLYNGEDFKREQLKDGDSLFIGSFTINIEDVVSNDQSNQKKEVDESFKPSEIGAFLPKLDHDRAVGNDVAIDFISNEQPLDLKSDSTAEFYDIKDIEEDEMLKVEKIEEVENESGIAKELDEGFHFDDSETGEIEISQNENLASSLVDENIVGTELEEIREDTSYSLDNIDRASDDGTKVIKSFAKIELELFGTSTPYDKYLLDSEKTYIGRDKSKCQIVLNQSDVSVVHAVITKNNSMITLEDLNSSNGTILNGNRINKATLSHDDEFVIGEVTFTVKIRSDFLKEESSTLMAVEENQSIEIEEVVEVQVEEDEYLDALGNVVNTSSEEKSIIKRIWKDDSKRKIAIFILLGGVGAWVFFPDLFSTPTPIPKPKKVVSRDTVKDAVKNTAGRKLSDEERQSLSARYEIAFYHYQEGRYREALEDFQIIASISPSFKSLQSLIALSKEGLSKLEEQEKKRVLEQAAAEKKIKIKGLLEKAAEYVKDHRVELAQEVFNDISKIDPENIDVSRLKLELDDWQREKAKKELEELTIKKARDDKVEKLKPGKLLFIQKEWFKAAGRLDEFLKIKDMDEDLTKEASEMLKVSRDEIASAVSPLIGKAKSLMEGQDIKGAYEIYQQILKIEPSHAEALNMIGDIKDQLTIKARKIYREAIISESLSLFQDAKEKLQEVQQVSPVDSDYYKKATDKLKDYLD